MTEAETTNLIVLGTFFGIIIVPMIIELVATIREG